MDTKLKGRIFLQITGVMSCAIGAITLVFTAIIAFLKVEGPDVLAQFPAAAVAALIIAGAGLLVFGVYLFKKRNDKEHAKYILVAGIAIAAIMIVFWISEGPNSQESAISNLVGIAWALLIAAGAKLNLITQKG